MLGQGYKSYVLFLEREMGRRRGGGVVEGERELWKREFWEGKINSKVEIEFRFMFQEEISFIFQYRQQEMYIFGKLNIVLKLFFFQKFMWFWLNLVFCLSVVVGVGFGFSVDECFCLIVGRKFRVNVEQFGGIVEIVYVLVFLFESGSDSIS